MPSPVDVCNHAGPNRMRCELPAGHKGGHQAIVETAGAQWVWMRMPNGQRRRVKDTDWVIHEWNDAGHRVLDASKLGRALSR